MENYSNGGGPFFWRSVIAWGVTIGGVLVPAQVGATNIFVGVVIKVFATAIGAFLAAFLTSLSNDVYKYYKRKLYGKKKEDDESSI